MFGFGRKQVPMVVAVGAFVSQMAQEVTKSLPSIRKAIDMDSSAGS
jgi:hypothetical protein